MWIGLYTKTIQNLQNYPLVLVALKEQHSLFKEISHNPYLIAEGINDSYANLEMEQLRFKALEVIEHINSEKIQELVQSYEKAQSVSLGSSDINQVAKAAYENRVETILIEEDRIIPGKINNAGDVIICDITQPGL